MLNLSEEEIQNTAQSATLASFLPITALTSVSHAAFPHTIRGWFCIMSRLPDNGSCIWLKSHSTVRGHLGDYNCNGEQHRSMLLLHLLVQEGCPCKLCSCNVEKTRKCDHAPQFELTGHPHVTTDGCRCGSGLETIKGTAYRCPRKSIQSAPVIIRHVVTKRGAELANANSTSPNGFDTTNPAFADDQT